MSQPAIGHHVADVLYAIAPRDVLHAIGDNDTKDRAPAPLGVSADSLDQASDGVVERCSAAWLILRFVQERKFRQWHSVSNGFDLVVEKQETETGVAVQGSLFIDQVIDAVDDNAK